MQNVLSKTNIFNLLICQLISKFSRDKLISQSSCKSISIDKKKFRKEKITRKKSVRDNNIIKIMRIDNVFSTNMLIFCDSENESKSSILLLFVKSKNIKS